MFPISASFFVYSYKSYLSKEILASIRALNLEDDPLEIGTSPVSDLCKTEKKKINILVGLDLASCPVCKEIPQWLKRFYGARSPRDTPGHTCGKDPDCRSKILDREFQQALSLYALEHLRASRVAFDILGVITDPEWENNLMKFLKVHHMYKKQHPRMWSYVLREKRSRTGCASQMLSSLDPDKLRLILSQIQGFFTSSTFPWYRETQTYLDILYCLLKSCLPQLEILLNFGHEISFIEDELTTEEVARLWNQSYSHHFHVAQFNIMRYQPKRALLYMQMYLTCVGEVGAKDVTKLIWRALPYTPITKIEMQSFLEIAEIERDKIQKVRQAFENFEKICDDLSPTPRSVAHYCRCKIRSVLNARGLLPEGINQLKLPERLKSYLKLEL